MSIQHSILQLTLGQRIDSIRNTIQELKVDNEVTLVAVSKTQPASLIAEAFQEGVTHFGENYLQEALTKQNTLKHLPIIWHFIGPIQSNKTALIAQQFDWVDSVDRQKIAQRLSEARLLSGKTPLSVCIQVNISHELSKSGVDEKELPQLAHCVSLCRGLQLRGLMAIPDPRLSDTELRMQFRKMKDWFDQLRQQYSSMDTLSMGMTQDYLMAISEGATQVRVGTGIFGVREK
ncbi:MAG: YggS family pyridoxal phosphate enzyme [Ferrovum sp. 37-45-19]|uniref:YggS family pyridoxal phosphate-dependent enzyme n=1 Tax=Ferrovum sp. JA12 TaxID=1356299 RepID=UPI00070253C0|nr:YggS family pyridoxal phosphate-dependent enzyme [Ferrovum sp. JA12]OYV80507.1 MAG: YggS family pyridoxal phosphate enzyme [Ferrovum sp. 21-44-67]OYV94822.1 MAG: YggS family pyridoxal phosphate enzyme [Ferrovum sp. 37-45-19]OZB34145.1 MAG: YggS family pyridoxal phosphate enzyme [Ferrovum sp. 34-44-207]HQT81050.1 YggS family pyridoxal phosphate-dependent enzyme [Ferrovaceae bacterium]KRH79225.1 hypothetical protein FERRO_02880 [Ferrovum sp. JA12]